MSEKDCLVSPTRIAAASPICELNRDSYERTNGRTYAATNPDGDHLTLGDADARVQAGDVVGLSEVMAAGFMPTGKRFPVLRNGLRAVIPWHVRSAVWYRDGGSCQHCRRQSPKPWHLHHIVPWSAQGSDRTDNLRLLCERCNLDRSNYDDGTVFAKRPVTWWCHRCYSPERAWTYGATSGWDGFTRSYNRVLCGQYAHHRRCRVQAHYRRELDSGEQPTWHERPPVESADLIAYCAHCDVVGMTDVTL